MNAIGSTLKVIGYIAFNIYVVAFILATWINKLFNAIYKDLRSLYDSHTKTKI